MPLIGLVITGVGIALAAAGEAAGQALNSAKLILAGTVILQFGVLILTPALVGVAGRFGRKLPVAGRLALRDAARHRGRTAPAVGAIMAAVAGSTAVGVYAVSNAHHIEREYSPSARQGVVTVQFDERNGETKTAAAEKLRKDVAAVLPTRASTLARSVGCFAARCTQEVSLRWAPPIVECEQGMACRSAQGFSSVFPGPLVGDRDVLRACLGRSDPVLESALAAGKTIAFVPGAVTDGSVTFERFSRTGAGGPPEEVVLPGVQAAQVPGLLALVPPQAATKLGDAHVVGVIVDTSRMPSQEEEDAARQVLETAALDAYLTVERGFHSNDAGVLLALLLGTTVITIGAAGIATGLAAADGRADLATLAAVGAAPATRRKLAAAQALTVAGLGTLLGVGAGFVPAVAYIHRLPDYTVDVPWQTLGLLVMGVPVLAALLAALLTRNRLPMMRRTA